MTVFCVNEGLAIKNSGIEHAQFDRCNLFRKHGVDFKLLTSVYIWNLHDILPHFNLRDTESLNLFDYFQEATNVKPKTLTFDDLDFGIDASVTQTSPHHYDVHAQSNPNLFLGRIVYTNGHLQRAEYFDLAGNLYKTITFDSRGFASLVQYLNPDGHLETENWLTPAGKVAIIKTYLRLRDKIIESWRVNNHVFNTLQDLRTYFYNCINQGDNIFILDRANVSQQQMLNLRQPAYKAFILHNMHTADANNPDEPLLNDNYEWSLHNLESFDCVISATPNQTADVKKRFKPVHPRFFTIPVGIVSDSTLTEKRIPLTSRKPHSMVVTARVAAEKGIDKMINALAIAQKQIPELTLDVYGDINHGNGDEVLNAINAAKSQLKNPDSVTLHGHTEDVANVQKQYQIYLIYSRMEGFNLALMEAQSHGCVGLTNDVNYGPNYLVQNGENGLVVPFDDTQAYADAMVKLFSDSQALQKMSDASYNLSNRFSEEMVWEAWENLFADFNAWKERQHETN